MSGWLYGFGMALLVALSMNYGWAGPRPLTRAEMESARGGHGPSCTECTADFWVFHECNHSTPSDPCQGSQCIEFQIIEDTCFIRESGICLAELDPYSIAAVKYLREDTNCTTNNSGPSQVVFTHYYGSECLSRYWLTRCPKTGGPCNGELIDSADLYLAIACY
ncbi:MAG: hypothetical protein HUU16_14380 [Candidatus Omnitrophica bacterium]|nr:hypothetical protein [bacterium]NUN97348.1 hypothetical protein [Candidatus Omnitrophota bacterium]